MRSARILAVVVLVLGPLAAPAQARFRVAYRPTPRATETYSPGRSGHFPHVHASHGGGSSSSSSSSSDDSSEWLLYVVIALICAGVSVVVGLAQSGDSNTPRTLESTALPRNPSTEDFDWTTLNR